MILHRLKILTILFKSKENIYGIINLAPCTLQWARLRLKSQASRLFTQPLIQAQSKENIKAPRHWPLYGEFTGTGEFPALRASNTENVSIWWRHHARSPLDVVMTGAMWLSSYNSLEFMTASWCYLNGVTLDACTCLFCRQFLFWYHTDITKVKRLSKQ